MADSCIVAGATYSGKWRDDDNDYPYFELEKPVWPGSPLPIEDHDLDYDDDSVLGWYSATVGKYTATPVWHD